VPRTSGQVAKRSGVTLVELLVAMTILALIVGVSGLAFGSLRAPRGSQWVREARAARTKAIEEGTPVAVPSVRPSVLFLPDGRAIGPSADPLTGAPSDSAH
jgi:prepilin-type N-terminal cleavage/methylation domain-containing protein